MCERRFGKMVTNLSMSKGQRALRWSEDRNNYLYRASVKIGITVPEQEGMKHTTRGYSEGKIIKNKRRYGQKTKESLRQGPVNHVKTREYTRGWMRGGWTRTLNERTLNERMPMISVSLCCSPWFLIPQQHRHPGSDYAYRRISWH